MARAPLREVRWLTLDALAQEWALELHQRQDVVLQELRLGVINLPRLERGEGLIPTFPADDDQPNAHEYRVDREWVDRFAAKNRWPLPRFWFGDGPTGRPVGRPRLAGWDEVQREMEQRIHDGLAHNSWNVESNYLAAWIAEQITGQRTPSAKSIRNELGKLRETLIQAQN